MKIVMLLAAALLAAPPARAEEGKYAKLAHNVITSTAQVKPGEVVLISGGKHTTPLLEELAIETFKAGGLPVISLDSDRIERAVGFDVKADYLSQEWKFYGEWLKTTDVLINLPNIEDPALFARIPADRQAKLGAAGAVITEALNKSHVRSINLAFPSRQEAAA